MNDYDAIVIGSGIGGMCAAARLATAGLKVLVLERLPILGGRCSTLEYRGFKLTTGAVSVECGGALERTFQELGAEFPVREPSPRVRYRLAGRDYDMPDKGWLAFLINTASRNAAEAEAFLNTLQRGVTGPAPSRGLTVRDWLLQHTDNEVILGIFQAMCGGIFSLNSYEAAAGEFFGLIKNRGFSRFGFPFRGHVALIDSLAAVVRKCGGEIWTEAKVENILTEGSMVTSLAVRKGREKMTLGARFVVSNVGPARTVELVGAAHFDEAYLERVSQMRASHTLVIEAISAKPLIDFPGVMMLPGSRRIAFIACMTISCPELTATGKHCTTLLGPPEHSTDPVDLRRQFDLMLEDAREHIPSFDGRVEHLFTRSFRGEWPGYHAQPGWDLPQTTPVQNLYNVGDGVKVAGHFGLGGSAEAARLVVADILGTRRA